MSVGVLTLNIKNKCQAGSCSCGKTPDKFGLKVSKETTIPNVAGFVRYTHELDDGNTFTLKGELHGNEKLGDASDIQDVIKVSVYYWDNDHGSSTAKPLILEFVKSSNTSQPDYYTRYEDGEQELKGEDETIWVHHGYSGGLSLQDRLDDRNCARNKVIPFDLENPTRYRNFGSGVSKSKGITFSSFTPLPGSEHIVTSYSIVGDTSGPETGISRVENNKEKISEITIPHGALAGVRLYSSPVSPKIPLMIELVGVSGGPSTFYASKGEKGGWNSDKGDAKDFYDGGKEIGKQKPKEALNNKLDEVTCFYRDAVTIDLSLEKSTTKKDNWYCCNTCRQGKVSVKEILVNHHAEHRRSTKLYKHSITNDNYTLSAIKYYLHNHGKENRKHIAPRKMLLPITGPVDVYTFYCNGNPSLIYVDAEKEPKATGWYRKSSKGYTKSWTRLNSQLKGLAPKDLENGIDCNIWMRLKKVLSGRGCTTLEDCPKGSISESLQQEDEEEPSDDDSLDNVVDLGISVSTEVGRFWRNTLDTVIKSALPEIVDLVNKSMNSTSISSSLPGALVSGDPQRTGSDDLLNGLLSLGINIPCIATKFGLKINDMLNEVVERTLQLTADTIKIVTKTDDIVSVTSQGGQTNPAPEPKDRTGKESAGDIGPSGKNSESSSLGTKKESPLQEQRSQPTGEKLGIKDQIGDGKDKNKDETEEGKESIEPSLSLAAPDYSGSQGPKGAKGPDGPADKDEGTEETSEPVTSSGVDSGNGDGRTKVNGDDSESAKEDEKVLVKEPKKSQETGADPASPELSQQDTPVLQASQSGTETPALKGTAPPGGPGATQGDTVVYVQSEAKTPGKEKPAEVTGSFKGSHPKTVQHISPLTTDNSTSFQAPSALQSSEPPQRDNGSTSDLATNPKGGPTQSISEAQVQLVGASREQGPEPTASALTQTGTSTDGKAEKLGAEAGITAAAGSVLWTAFGASSGTLAGTGGLTGFTYWMYKRLKGDPWVRQL
ncbi:hypothetical protein BEWA_008290 [Theileria equi strain WA]|uniref:Uncharacterized protein n=1 Tax=Theileria equi strain WA TaxID=1537102 RepID=L0B2U8_THEEQ|nr:hypothetical protein BEWA_008290 [Theileria equi strain WA]AFZ81419.1 hypothetical protein BEWA_008290 [Theileria equi strain WA]|eukprot:XP_004831085.1 hypothetical protein BEWA_008290 [Theileria equi strain WA]